MPPRIRVYQLAHPPALMPPPSTSLDAPYIRYSPADGNCPYHTLAYQHNTITHTGDEPITHEDLRIGLAQFVHDHPHLWMHGLTLAEHIQLEYQMFPYAYF
jgi:hypothetical protein